MKCPNCGANASAGAVMCQNCWHRMPANPGAGTQVPPHGGPSGGWGDLQGGSQGFTGGQTGGQTHLISDPIGNWWGQLVEFQGVSVIGIEDLPDMPKPGLRLNPGNKGLITIVVMAVIVYFAWHWITHLISTFFANLLLVLILVVAFSVMFGGQDILSELIMLPFKVLKSIITAILSIFSTGLRDAGGAFGQSTAPQRIPVKNITVSVDGQPRVIRVEGRFSIGGVGVGHMINVSARHKAAYGSFLFVKGYNVTMGVSMIVSKN